MMGLNSQTQSDQQQHQAELDFLLKRASSKSIDSSRMLRFHNNENNNPSDTSNSNSDYETDISYNDPIVSNKNTKTFDELSSSHHSHDYNDEPESQSRIQNKSKSSEDKATGMTLRCVCNLSQCASQNYMCKSERRVLEDGTEIQPGCFTQELESFSSSSTTTGSESGQHHQQQGVTESNGKVTSARRGCIEMLSREKQKSCTNRAGDPIQCCFNDDMCNYPRTFYPPSFSSSNGNGSPVSGIHRSLGSSGNGVFDSAGGPGSRISNGNNGSGAPGIGLNSSVNLDHHIWLRAAVIAVPVCGLMILIVLIIVARKLLKSDDEYYKNETTSTNSSLMVGCGGGRNKNYNNRRNPGHNFPPYPPSYSHNQSHKQFGIENPPEYLLPLDAGASVQQQHCFCCQNHPTASSPTPTVDSIAPTNLSPESEEVVAPAPTHHPCQCGLMPNLAQNQHQHFYTFPPPAIILNGDPSLAASASTSTKKYNFLRKLGFSRNRVDSASVPFRPFQV